MTSYLSVISLASETVTVKDFQHRNDVHWWWPWCEKL